MLPESSPFTPGQPAPLDSFVGRIAEIERLRSMVRASLFRERLKVGFITGERGIGKSSLVSFVRHVCERVEDDAVAGIHVYLGGATSLSEMVKQTFDSLLKESMDKPWHQRVRTLFGDHVRKVGLFSVSVEFNAKPEDLSQIVWDFGPSLRRLIGQLKEERKGLLLIFDDINGLANSAEFANWLKSTVDKIGTDNLPFPVCFLIVGLEERRQSLIRLQPSLARVLDVIRIRPWSEAETAEFFRKAFQNDAKVTIEDDALQTMVSFTGGLPVIAHEIGDAVWRIADGPVIKREQALQGALAAAEIIGLRLLEPQVLKAIRSKHYRSILRKLAATPTATSFRRAELQKKLTAEETKKLDNFLARMKRLGAIVPDDEAGPGSYHFANQLHQLYFWLESLRAKEEKER